MFSPFSFGDEFLSRSSFFYPKIKNIISLAIISLTLKVRSEEGGAEEGGTEE